MALTDKQNTAVSTRGEDILIAAAAGSGKTTVLTRRVKELVTEGADIRRMVICTYTRTAAAELKQRIYAQIWAAAEERRDVRLYNQAEYVSSAMIGTIHSFCTQVIRDNFLRAGLKVNWRTGNTSLCSRLKNEAADEAFHSLYEEDDEDMLWLARRYGGRDDSRLKEDVISMYELSRSMPMGIHAFKKDPSDFVALIEGNMKSYLCDAVRDMCLLTERCYAVAELHEDFDREIKNTDAMAAVVDALGCLAKRGDAQGMAREIAAFKFPRLASALKPKEAGDEYKAYKEALKKLTAKLSEALSSFDEISLEDEADYMSRLNGCLYKLLCRFEEIYDEKKSERGILDYDDLIHKAYALLKEEDIAAHYREKIDYVFLDEFQDTNDIQDALLERISRDGGRFIVGDVKQSIYSFRLADPYVFIKKAEDISRKGKVVYMNDNFRSAPVIIHEINRIMDGIMSRELGGVDYTDGERLAPGRDLEGGVRMLCAVSPKEGVIAEADMIAREIDKLVSEGRSPGDIAILVRKVAHVTEISEALSKRGIPTYFDGAATSPPEVDLFVDYLRLIDSENDDIPLLAVLRAPGTGFDEEEMAKVRCHTKEGSFSDALRAYDCEDELKAKIEGFLWELDRMRLLARTMPMEDFLIDLKSFTRFDEMLPALPGGEVRYDSFTRFFDKLLEYAKEGGLYSLICTLDRIKEKTGSYIESGDAAVAENCVNIMTVHRSKGLQFPVVFLAQTNLKFNFTDATKALIADRTWGAVSHILDAEALRMIPSRSKTLIIHGKRREILSEELRILYVALTRAEEKLYMTCSLKKEESAKGILPSSVTNFAGWLLPAFEDTAEYFYPDGETVEVQEEYAGCEEIISAALSAQPVQILSPEFIKVPVKLGVSSLLSPYETMDQAVPFSPQYAETEAPPRDKNAGTDFGTLIHAFFQYYDYRTMPSVEECIQDIFKRQLLTVEDCSEIRSFKPEIDRFLLTDLAARISCADEIMKELPFSIGVSARELGMESDDTIVIQGIIDLAIREGDEYVVIDYKTNLSRDYDRLREHYAPQLAFYKRALEECRGAKVKECMLCFLRSGKVLSL